MSVDSEIENWNPVFLPTGDDLKIWKVVNNKECLGRKPLKKTGNKGVLVNRVFRAMTHLVTMKHQDQFLTYQMMVY